MPNHEAIAEASPWVKRFATLIPPQGAVLDLACGSGRHSRYLVNAGFSVTAVDRDITVLASDNTPQITTQELDLELDTWPLKGRVFDGIVVSNYLYRPHLDQLPQMLAAGGVLIYETFAQGNEAFGKPSNPNFLLKTGELLALALRYGLKVVAYEDIYQDKPKPAMMQRICAVKAF
ncbi:bifunctional 2-polyprenyl-6-hydroxyphenol methylase/3-demethylubiquinol 3-O-methyltransferase UbiG [Polynucleobacter sp. 15G-AUS-farblos]|uniref:class I SAM-dependent methyltransferase n=1 Tax=Polynucleobacter sp. 15G-AUS-farblos TaxID=2689094 RepID=UPI001C20DD4E|nr:class I SAM-dependent methyltransferase [Polynucleobacter sp. 15G-AUS-farblos]